MRSSLKVAGAAAAALALSAGAAYGQAIESGSLQRIDIWSVGASPVGADSLSLPRELWATTDATALGALFDKLPASFTASPAASRLARQALTTSAAPPTGPAGASAARKRFEALARMGAAESVITMSTGSAEAKADSAIAQFAVQAELSRDRLTEACRRADGVVVEPPSRFLLRLRALCLAAGGSADGADLALTVARDAGAADPWFEAAVTHLTRRGPRPPAAQFSNTLYAAASLAADLRPGPDPLNGASMFSLGAVASTPSAPALLRASAAVAALKAEAVSAQTAREALRRAGAAKGAPPWASLVTSVDLADGAQGRAQAIAIALRSAKSHGELAALSRLFADDINDLPVGEAVGASAPVFARGFLALGSGRAARLWRNTLDPTAAEPEELARIDLALAALRGGDGVAVSRQRIDTAAAGSAGLVARDLAILRALGQPIGEVAESYINRTPAARGRKADTALLAQFSAAAERRAVGETVLLAALVVAGGAESLDPAATAEVVRGLKQVGAMQAARQVAVEAIIGGMAR